MYSHMHSQSLWENVLYICLYKYSYILEYQIYRLTKQLISFQIILSNLICPKLSEILNVQ